MAPPVDQSLRAIDLERALFEPVRSCELTTSPLRVLAIGVLYDRAAIAQDPVAPTRAVRGEADVVALDPPIAVLPVDTRDTECVQSSSTATCLQPGLVVIVSDTCALGEHDYQSCFHDTYLQSHRAPRLCDRVCYDRATLVYSKVFCQLYNRSLKDRSALKRPPPLIFSHKRNNPRTVSIQGMFLTDLRVS